MKNLILAGLVLVVVNCGGGGGTEESEAEGDESENVEGDASENDRGISMEFLGVLYFNEVRSDCHPGNNFERLKIYFNEQSQEFKLLGADDSVFLEGVLNEAMIMSYQGPGIYDSFSGETEESECYIEYRTGLHESCQSKSVSCDIYWE